MAKPLSLDQIGELLHISEIAADIYITLITHGELCAKDVKELLEYSLGEVNKGIAELQEKGLIWELKNEHDNVCYEALSPLKLEEHIDRQREVIDNLKRFVIPQVQKPEKLGIIKYEGWEGVRKVYLEILEEAQKTGQEIVAFENNLNNTEIGEIFIEKYIQRRIKSKISARVICPESPEDKKYLESHNGPHTEVRLSNDIQIDANINIVGSLVMTFSVRDNFVQGTLRRNHAEAQTWRSVFDAVWNKCTIA